MCVEGQVISVLEAALETLQTTISHRDPQIPVHSSVCSLYFKKAVEMVLENFQSSAFQPS